MTTYSKQPLNKPSLFPPLQSTTPSFFLTSLSPASEYEVTVLSVASSLAMTQNDITDIVGKATKTTTTKKYESEAATIDLFTLPEVVRNLRLDSATPNSIVIKWDAPAQVDSNQILLLVA